MEKKFLTEFIELYKSFPCLWKVKSKDYSDRNAKSLAYDVLVTKMKTVDQDANRDTVVRKINSLRSTYIKELKKVNASDCERSGTGAEDIYVPNLWYYDLLIFLLHDQEISRESASNMDEDDKSQIIEINEELESNADNLSQAGTPYSSRSDSSSSRPLSRSLIRSTKRRNEKCDDVLDAIQKRFKTPVEIDDKFAFIGKAWASKLRELPHEQVIHSEKLINDVFYEAQLGTLNRYCTLYIQPQQVLYLAPVSSHHHPIQSGSYHHHAQPHSQQILYDQQHTSTFNPTD